MKASVFIFPEKTDLSISKKQKTRSLGDESCLFPPLLSFSDSFQLGEPKTMKDQEPRRKREGGLDGDLSLPEVSLSLI